MKVYDCFMFYNELDLLNLRFHELNECVDFFVLVEGVKTHSNKPKPLYYLDNISKFSKFKDKIIHIVIENFPEKSTIGTENRWFTENYHRNCILRGLKDCKDDDIIFISDLDEIPRPDTINDIKKKSLKQSFALGQKYYYYDFKKLVGCYKKKKFIPCVWPGTIVTTYKLLQKTSPQKLRNKRWGKLPVIPKAGWHLSYFGGYKVVLNRLIQLCEEPWASKTSEEITKEFTEENLKERYKRNKSTLKNFKDNSKDLFHNEFDTELPKYYKLAAALPLG